MFCDKTGLLQLPFQLIPNALDETEVRVLCGPDNFFHTTE